VNVPFSIARRYLFSKGNRNVINIISGIATAGVAVGSLAMIIVLSAFNGLEGLVEQLYTTVDPDIRIEPTKGKVFDLDSFQYEAVKAWPEIADASPVLEETVFLQFDGEQSIVTLRGMQEEYLPNLGLDSHVVEGSLGFTQFNEEAAIIGYGIADKLNLFISDGVLPITVYAAKRDAVKAMNPQNKFNKLRVIPGSIVAMNPEFDYKYMYVSRAFAQDLLQYGDEASYVDFTLKNDQDLDEVIDRLKAHFGDGFTVKSRIEQNDVIYKTNAAEKWVTFFILCFIMIVATFNMIGSLAMLIIEKRKDISLLRTIGNTVGEVQRLFLYEGALITLLGLSIGLGLGSTIILLQQYVGFFPLQGGIVEFYPVKLELVDLFAVVGVTLSIGLGASYIPVKSLLNEKKLQRVISS
jgi:lipoprotein-releasing system permease protein